jgi:excisionase family DNA binding protein
MTRLPGPGKLERVADHRHHAKGWAMARTKTRTKKQPKKPATVADNGTAGEILTLAEAAAYLRVAETDVLQAVREQGLVGKQVGEGWRFLLSALRNWLSTPAKSTLSSNATLMSLAGAWKDDPAVNDLLQSIYEQRGRPMTEVEE